MTQGGAGQRLIADVVVPGEGAGEILFGGAVDVDAAGRIVAVGAEPELGPATGEVHRVGGLLMPGLINAHAHSPMTMVRSAGDGLPLQSWLTDAVWPREGRMTPDDVWWGQALGSIEMLLAGVTTSVEMYLFEDSIVDAAATVGQRVQMMAGMISMIVPDAPALMERLEHIVRLSNQHGADDEMVRVGIGAHSVWDLGADRIATIGQVAASNDLTVHVHLEETTTERRQVLDEYGMTATALLAERGVLDAQVVAAHGVWLDDADRSLLGQAGATVVHCPTSNLKLGSGLADVVAMSQAGIAVALGTDGPASNDDLNMWEEVRLAAMLARGQAHDPTAMSTAHALDMATRGAARAIGSPDIGELRPGAWADIVRVDLDHPSFSPGLADELFTTLVWAGSPEHVSDVWVAGKQVVVDGEVTTIDRRHAQSEVTARAAKLL